MRKDYPTAQRHVLKSPKEWLLKVPADNEHLVVNIGPSHPAMHGTFRVQALMDGETIQDCEAEIGYMHRNFEKMAESRTYWQIIPYTDRLNYCSSFMNGHGWALAVEKLLGDPGAAARGGRARDPVRVLADHGPLRLHRDQRRGPGGDHALLRAVPRPRGHLRPARGLLRRAPHRLLRAHRRPGRRTCPTTSSPAAARSWRASRDVTDQADKLLTRNSIFARRFKDVGVLSADDALSYGWVGPCLRGSGVAYDVRKDHPYSGYEQYDFDVPVGTVGDCYDRYLVRMEEIRQSLRIIEQALAKLPGGPGDRGRQAGGAAARSRTSTATSKP